MNEPFNPPNSSITFILQPTSSSCAFLVSCRFNSRSSASRRCSSAALSSSSGSTSAPTSRGIRLRDLVGFLAIDVVRLNFVPSPAPSPVQVRDPDRDHGRLRVLDRESVVTRWSGALEAEGDGDGGR